jgi:ArsR family transcriptional regulator
MGSFEVPGSGRAAGGIDGARRRADRLSDALDETRLALDRALALEVGVQLLALTSLGRELDPGAAADHPGGDVRVHQGISFSVSAPIIRHISILVNIDVDRYDARMPRPKQVLVDPDVQLLQALGHPTRLSIVRELAGSGEVCACDFTDCCGVRQPTVSHHLRILRQAGVIEAERRGTSIWYRLVPSAADRLRALAGELVGGPALIPAATLVGARRANRNAPATVRPS